MIGSFVISAPIELVKATFQGIVGMVNPGNKNEQYYMDLIGLLNELFAKITREGILSVESDILAKREKSPFFNKYPNILKKPRAVKFLCDSLAIVVDSDISADALETLMETEIETYRGEVMEVPHSVDKVADGLPGLGIVAAVLGVVVTMGKIDQPPKVLGESIGAALLGTFLGVLMCYGFVGPMGTHLGHKAKKEVIYLDIIKVALVAFMKGTPGRMSVEFAKRVIPQHDQQHDKK
jgi:chemotaxis protein MotA